MLSPFLPHLSFSFSCFPHFRPPLSLVSSATTDVVLVPAMRNPFERWRPPGCLPYRRQQTCSNTRTGTPSRRTDEHRVHHSFSSSVRPLLFHVLQLLLAFFSSLGDHLPSGRIELFNRTYLVPHRISIFRIQAYRIVGSFLIISFVRTFRWSVFWLEHGTVALYFFYLLCLSFLKATLSC